MVHIDTSAERYPKLHGTPASRGIALGKLTFLKRRQKPDIRHTVEDTAAEIQRFEDARAKAITQLGNLYEASLDKLGEQNAVLFQIHQLMLDDPDYVSQIHEFITTEKMNAEYAVDVVAKRFSEMFKAMDNDYMQGRAADVIDVSRRVTDILLSSHGTPLKSTSYTTYGDEPLILATDDLAPSETVSLDKEKVTGIVTSHGSTRSHTVIFARTMGLPAVISSIRLSSFTFFTSPKYTSIIILPLSLTVAPSFAPLCRSCTFSVH